jgi:sugar/nucleoside kinase (ribokinase family)
MRFKIVGIGEVLSELLPIRTQLDRAPARFACHAHTLGARACLVTRVGNHEFGFEILPHLEEQGIAVVNVKVSPPAYSPVRLALRSSRMDSSE